MRLQEFADRLLSVRAGAPEFDAVPEPLRPRDLAEAYAVADLLVAALASALGGVAGYKVGATSTQGQQLLGLTEPFFGRNFAQRIRRDGASWDAAGRPCSAEAEVGFVLGKDLPARRSAYSLSEVRAAVDRVVPLLEINRPAFKRPFDAGGLCLVADNGVTQGLVIGGPGGPLLAEGSLSGETVRMFHNDAVCAEGAAAAVLGDPINALWWLANALRVRGRGLHAGETIASGAMTPPIPLVAGDRIVAEYSTLGRAAVNVERL